MFCGGVVCCCGVGVVGGGFCDVFGGLLESVSPPPVGRNLHCGWRVRSRAVVVSQQGISLLEGRCVR